MAGSDDQFPGNISYFRDLLKAGVHGRAAKVLDGEVTLVFSLQLEKENSEKAFVLGKTAPRKQECACAELRGGIDSGPDASGRRDSMQARCLIIDTPVASKESADTGVTNGPYYQPNYSRSDITWSTFETYLCDLGVSQIDTGNFKLWM